MWISWTLRLQSMAQISTNKHGSGLPVLQQTSSNLIHNSAHGPAHGTFLHFAFSFLYGQQHLLCREVNVFANLEDLHSTAVVTATVRDRVGRGGGGYGQQQ